MPLVIAAMKTPIVLVIEAVPQEVLYPLLLKIHVLLR